MILPLNLKYINAQYGNELKQACSRVIDSGWYINGEEVKAFEDEFSSYIGVEYCLGVGNGFDALSISLRTWKELGMLHDGDEVIVQSNTFVASVFAITENNLIPILVEPSPVTFNLTLEAIEEHVTAKTRVILPVHLYGQISPMKDVVDYANSNQLLVLEDCAQSHGATLGNSMAGNFGEASAFSFYPGKNLGALGDAGAICSNDTEFIKLAKKIANYGSETKYKSEYKGLNSRLDEIQAAMLRVKLRYLNNEISSRRKIAQNYDKYINNRKVVKPCWNSINEHVFHQYVVRVKKRDLFIEHMLKFDVQVAIHYPVAIHKQNCFKFSNFSSSITDEITETIVSIPISPFLSSEEVRHIIKTINVF